MGNMDVEAQLGVNTAGFDGPMKKSAEVATATGRAVEKAAKSAADAQVLAAKYATTVISQETLKQISSIKATQVAQKDYYTALAYTKRGLLDEAEGSQVTAAALQRLTAVRMEATEAAKLQGRAEGAVISKQMAASGIIRMAAGQDSIRAVERFISTIPGLGAALQTIFPIIGGLAFAGILVDIGEKIYKVEQNAAHAADAIASVFQESHDKAAITIDDLNITNDKLQEQIDKLGGVQNNGLAVALDDARKMADQLVVSLQADRKELQGLLKDHEVGNVGALLSGVSATGRQGSEMLNDQKALIDQVRSANEQLDSIVASTTDETAIKNATEKRNAAVHAAFQSQIDTYTRERDRLQKEQEDSRKAPVMPHLAMGVSTVAAPVAIDNSAKLANITGRLKQLQDAQIEEKLQESIFARTAAVGAANGNKGSEAAANKAAEQKLKGYEAQLAEMKTQTTVSAKAEFDYWAQRIAAFQRGSEQYDAVIAKQASLAVEGAKTAHELILKYQKESNATANLNPAEATRGIDAIRKLMGEADDNITRSGQRWRLYNEMIAKNTELVIKNAEAMRALQIERGVKMGTISKGSAAQSMSDIHASASVATIADLKQELAKLKTEETHDPVTGQNTDSKNASAQQGVLNQITVEQGKAQLQAMQDQWAVFSESALGGAVAALGEFTAASRDSAAQMKQVIDSTLNSVNSAILKDLTDKNYQRRGDWTGAGKSIFTDISGTALKKGEGSIMGMIPGLVGAKLGTQNNPMWTRSVEKLLTGTSKADMDSISSLLPQRTPGASFALPPSLFPGTGMPGAASSTGTLDAGAAALGKSLFGSNGPAMPNVTSVMNSDDQAPAALASIGMKALFASIPFMASGGDFDAGTTAMVGEQGPELVHFGSAGHVTPNHKLSMGGGDTHHTWNIDARGSNNPAQTMAMVQQGILQAAPHLIAATKKSMQSDNSRVAPSARR